MLIPTIAILGALIPTGLYVLFVWWLDRYEKEPFWLLAFAFLWGAIPATTLSALLEYITDSAIQNLGGQGLAGTLVSAGIGAPVIEESAKGLALLLLVLLFPREVDDELDGIVYGALIGFGFAFSENSIAYFYPILQQQGIEVGLLNILLRSVVFGFNHALWTAIVGAAVAYAHMTPGRARRVLVPLGGWLLAVSLHAVHNAAATLADRTFFLTLGISAVVGWSGVFLLLGVVVHSLQRESRWLERGLFDEVRSGALSVEEYAILRSASRRLWVRAGALSRGGPPAYRAVGRYFQCATELAFRKCRQASPRAEKEAMAEIEQLRRRLGSLRPESLPWL
jgi:RsiW-degrading membrane proteinase PrsW (M82 family)